MDELQLIGSAPFKKHVFKVADFDQIENVQSEIISLVCSGVEEQLGEIVSGEEGKNFYQDPGCSSHLHLLPHY